MYLVARRTLSPAVDLLVDDRPRLSELPWKGSRPVPGGELPGNFAVGLRQFVLVFRTFAVRTGWATPFTPRRRHDILNPPRSIAAICFSDSFEVSVPRARLRAIRSALPEGRLTNAEITARFPEWNAEKILKKTGIRERRIAAHDECASDLGERAARRLFDEGLCSPEEVDFLLVCTQSPDYVLPTTACLLQHRLGLRTDVGAFDFNLGCSGFVYGLSVAKGLIEAGIVRNVLLITTETYSKFLGEHDKSTRTIFGDAAAATLISADDSPTAEEAIGPFLLGTDGAGGDYLIIRSGGARMPGDHPQANERAAKLYMDGPGIYRFSLEAVPRAIHELLRKSGRTVEEIDLFVLHQANQFMLEAIRKEADLPTERFGMFLAEVGNTVSATIPIALEHFAATGRLKLAARTMLVGFGVGLSWAACLADLRDLK